MKLNNVIAVSGESGLFLLETSKTNGLVLRHPITNKVKFYSVRQHQFTPLETVGIYTHMDTEELKNVLKSIKDKEGELPVVSIKATNKELFDYFKVILPDFDEDRVHASDIKKVIKWYNFLKEIGYLDIEEEVA